MSTSTIRTDSLAAPAATVLFIASSEISSMSCLVVFDSVDLIVSTVPLTLATSRGVSTYAVRFEAKSAGFRLHQDTGTPEACYSQ